MAADPFADSVRLPAPVGARSLRDPAPLGVIPFSIQFLSDVHLEFRKDRQVEDLIAALVPRCPYLVLAGDIGNPSQPCYARFLEAASKRFAHVFLIAGNHEFYGSSINETLGEIRSVVAPWPNVHFLHNETYVAEDLPFRIFGGTMWSDISAREEAAVVQLISDYDRIRGFTPSLARNEHHVFVDLLEAELGERRPHPAPLIVVSHHLPRLSLVHPRYRDSPINSAFASDVRLAEDPRIAAWIYGHTHAPHHGPRFFCNPIGYPGENGAITLERIVAFSPLGHRPHEQDEQRQRDDLGPGREGRCEGRGGCIEEVERDACREEQKRDDAEDHDASAGLVGLGHDDDDQREPQHGDAHPAIGVAQLGDGVVRHGHQGEQRGGELHRHGVEQAQHEQQDRVADDPVRRA